MGSFMSKNKARSVRSIFTLIELLVILSVIAILSLVLVPALTQARKATEKITCLNNQKEISFGFNSYLNNNNNYYPKSYICEEGWYWSNILYAELEAIDLYEEGTCKCGKHQKVVDFLGFCSRGNTKEEGTVFHCPSQVVSPSMKSSEYPVSYAMSWFLGGSPTYDSISYSKPLLHSTKVLTPDSAALVLETGELFAGSWTWRTRTIPNGFFEANDGVHDYGINVLYVDGHAGYSSELDIPTVNSSDEGRPFWWGIPR